MPLRIDYSKFYPVSGSSLNATNAAVNDALAGYGGGGGDGDVVTSVNGQTGVVRVDLPSLFPQEDLIPLIYLHDSLRFTSVQEQEYAEDNMCTIRPGGFHVYANDEYDRRSSSLERARLNLSTESVESGARSECSLGATSIGLSSKAATANGGASNAVYVLAPPAPESGTSSTSYYVYLPLANGTLITREDAIALIEAATSPLIARIEALESGTP